MKRMRPIVGKDGRMVFNIEGRRMMAPVEVPVIDLTEMDKRLAEKGWIKQSNNKKYEEYKPRLSKLEATISDWPQPFRLNVKDERRKGTSLGSVSTEVFKDREQAKKALLHIKLPEVNIPPLWRKKKK